MRAACFRPRIAHSPAGTHVPRVAPSAPGVHREGRETGTTRHERLLSDFELGCGGGHFWLPWAASAARHVGSRLSLCHGYGIKKKKEGKESLEGRAYARDSGTMARCTLPTHVLFAHARTNIKLGVNTIQLGARFTLESFGSYKESPYGKISTPRGRAMLNQSRDNISRPSRRLAAILGCANISWLVRASLRPSEGTWCNIINKPELHSGRMRFL